MPEPAYLIVASDDPQAGSAACARLRAEGWRRLMALQGAEVWAPDDAPSPIVAAGETGVVLGRSLRPRTGGGVARPPDLWGEAWIAWLLAEAWGEYVALAADPGGAHLVLRDPSAGIECLTWRTREGLAVAASDIAITPAWLQPARPSISWDRVAAFLNAPSAGASASLFDDVVSLPPGGVVALGGARAPRLAWRPAAFVEEIVPDLAAAEAELVRRVDLATAGLMAGHPRLVFELSGGLDSSIVAGSVAAAGLAGRVTTWCNAVSDRRDGDERRYAAAVAERLGVSPTFVAHRIAPLTVDDFAELARGFRPATSGVDATTDRTLAARIRGDAATGVVSGQGGDAAFYQMPSSYLVTDLLRRDGWAAVVSPGVAAMARRRRRSAWQELGAGWTARRLRTLPARTNRFLTPEAAAWAETARHPWEADGLDLPLSKQLHVRGLAQAHAPRGRSRRTLAAPLLCPLMAQPVVELCLAIPAVDLAVGVQDRPLARRAFADRLPAAVRDRRSKGEVTAYFARTLAASAEALGPYLLDGNLADAGVLDRGAVARALDPEQLIHAPRPAELLMAAATEAWVRYWQTRVPDGPKRGPWRR